MEKKEMRSPPPLQENNKKTPLHTEREEMYVHPSVEVFRGDCGPNEKLKRPVKKRGNNKQYLKALPTGMKVTSARGMRDSLGLPPQTYDTGHFHTYSGTFNAHGVSVCEQPDLNWLHYQGCFGKGVLSKSDPSYHRKLRGMEKGTFEKLSAAEMKAARKDRREEGIRKGKNSKKKAKRMETMGKSAVGKKNTQTQNTNKGDTKATTSALNTQQEFDKNDCHNPTVIVATKKDQQGINAGHQNNIKQTRPTQQHEQVHLPIAPTEEQYASKRKHEESNCSSNKTSSTVNPFTTKEFLQLSLVEAFFLKYGLDCLRILDLKNKEMFVLDCWSQFRQAQPNFVERYVVYQHLRSRGWIPKSGLKFAVDFLAYRQGPAYYHSSYSVCVETAWEDTLEPWNKDHSRHTSSWQRALSLGRMSAQAGKEMIVCTVIRPRHVTDSLLNSPECVKHFKVTQVLQRRWLPSRSRKPKETATTSNSKGGGQRGGQQQSQKTKNRQKNKQSSK
eukprot:m.39043 g.39043  ORF g.39043 m.39043 type:complete len:501 (+) comp10260_c0_seq1:112-1614(+)